MQITRKILEQAALLLKDDKQIDIFMESDKADQILQLYEELPPLRITIYQPPSGGKEAFSKGIY